MSQKIYKVIVWLVRLFFPKIEVTGLENLPDEPALFIGNHAQMGGPITAELYFPVKRRTWCAGEMMHLKEVPAYAFTDFWSFKPVWCRWFYRLLSYIIAPIAVCIFNNAETIEVYHDARIVDTFRETMRYLSEGVSMVIFPEKNEHYNHILYAFQEHFVDVARFYYRKNKKDLLFVPMYLSTKLRRLVIGKPIRFDHTVPIAEERTRIIQYLMEQITEEADSLPLHTVIPYRNIRKKDYPTNHPKEDRS